ncbi:hypothetical protein D3C75_1161230 [compost metagenome]
MFHGLLNTTEGGFNISRRLFRMIGQFAYFARNNSEATPQITYASSFNHSIQAEQVRLFRYFTNHVGYFGYTDRVLYRLLGVAQNFF